MFAKEEETIFDNTFCPYFMAYAKDFKSSNSTAFTKIDETIEKEEKNIALKKNEKSSSELKIKLNSEFYSAVKKVEREKILHFALTYKQQTLIIKAPTDNDEQKKFLGYTNSERRHNEGLKETEGLLTNVSDRNAQNKLAFYVRSQFDNVHCHNPQLEKYVQYVCTADMLEFSKVYFDLQMKPTTERKSEKTSKYPTKLLENILVKVNGSQTKIPSENIQETGTIPVITQESGSLISGYTDDVEPITDLPLIVFGDHSCTFKYIDFEFVRGADGTQLIKVDKDYLLKYVYEYMCTLEIVNSGKYERHFKYLKDITIPLPPRDLQQKIIVECGKIEDEFNTSKKIIEDSYTLINNLVTNINNDTNKIKNLCDINKHTIDPTKTPDKEFIYIDIDSVQNGEGYFKTDKIILGKNAPSRARRYAKDNSILISTVRPNLKGFAFINKEIKNAVYSTGFAIIKSRNQDIIKDKMIYYLFMYSENLTEQMIAAMPKGQYPSINKEDIENFQIPVPPLAEQQRIVSQIEQYEAQIAEAKAIMSGCADRKKKILEKYLN